MTYLQNALPMPRVVRIEPAAACNLRCSHCPTGTVEMTRGIMTEEIFQIALKNLSENLTTVNVVVLYHGGEPLLNRNFARWVTEIKKLGIPLVKTVSNGMLLNTEKIHQLVHSGLDILEFSLDGQSAVENDSIRRNSNYKTVVSNIKELIDYKTQSGKTTPKIYISTAQFIEPTTYNKDTVAEAPEYLIKEFGGRYASQFAGFKPTFVMRWPHMKVEEEVYGLYFDSFDEEQKNSCDHVENTITVRWNGEIVACCYDLTSMHVLGNINRKSLQEIWNDFPYRALRNSIKERKLIPMCDNCNVLKKNVYLILKNSESPVNQLKSEEKPFNSIVK